MTWSWSSLRRKLEIFYSSLGSSMWTVLCSDYTLACTEQNIVSPSSPSGLEVSALALSYSIKTNMRLHLLWNGHTWPWSQPYSNLDPKTTLTLFSEVNCLVRNCKLHTPPKNSKSNLFEGLLNTFSGWQLVFFQTVVLQEEMMCAELSLHQ